MPSSPSSNRSRNNAARDEVLSQLMEDHKRVKKAYKAFQKIDAQQDPESCEAIVQEVLDELTLHASLEEEFLYPVARDAIKEPDLIDEAEVEHESMHPMIDTLRAMSAGDEKYAARFTVLCEYVLHHVKEEEKEMFPQLERAKLEWEGIAQEMAQRRAEAAGEQGVELGDDESLNSSDDEVEESRALRSGSADGSQRSGSESPRGKATGGR